ncbi:MAG TPA: alpha/beta hydrolase domain-containing protein, partial [Candidatus Binatia bacterium]|nr:alpha/beta hydrolase domain-containing protein [Candidatus Binatia bacterium]
MITKIVIDSVQSPAFAGVSFGEAGRYEKLVGRAFGELEPTSPLNAVITDLALAPRNARGRVEYVTDFYILKSVDAARGNKVLLCDLTNRGNKMTYLPLNFPFRAPPQFPPINDPSTAEDAGTGYLMRQGYTIVWTGWDATAQAGNGRLTMTVPVASAGGKPIVGPALEEIMIENAQNVAPDGEVFTWPLTYPAATLDTSRATLTVRKYRGDQPTVIPAAEWQYLDASTIGLLPAGKKSFARGMLYQFVYPATDPKVTGIGFAAVRDFVSFLRHAGADEQGTANPLAGALRWSIATGLSQSGRFHRPFLYLGFNQDEHGRQVFDGMMPYINGAGGGFFNYRFAQPNRTAFQRWSHVYPEQIFPFAYTSLTDPLTGKTDSVLARCAASGTCPKVMEVNDSNSYWFKSAALAITTPDGTKDLPDPPNVRFYLLSSIAHGVASGRGLCQQLQNPISPGPALRALLAALTDWVVRGKEPPPSRVPRLSEGTLVPPLPQAAVGFPEIPGVTYTGVASVRELYDYGPEFDRGIISILPPVATGRAYPTLVPKVTADGIDMAGIQLPDIAVPLGTYTGWNLLVSAPKDECSAMGSFIPFATTKAQRLAAGDPRPSLEERYATQRGYVKAVEAVAERLVAERLLLPEDAKAYVEAAGRRELGLPR